MDRTQKAEMVEWIGGVFDANTVVVVANGGLSVSEFESLRGELRNAGIIEPRREAKNVVYRLADAKAERLVETLHGLFCPDQPPPARAAKPPRPGALGKFLGAAVFAKVGLMAADNDDS